MILSILLAYYVYESGQANKNPRSVGKFRTGRLCRQLDSASDGPLEPWEQVEARLIAEGRIALSTVRDNIGSYTVRCR